MALLRLRSWYKARGVLANFAMMSGDQEDKMTNNSLHYVDREYCQKPQRDY